MGKGFKKDKEIDWMHKELKISELEKWLESFRITHGESKLLQEIGAATGDKKKPAQKTEPRISEIENMFNIFRGKHGHDKLIESIDEATGNKKNETAQNKREDEHFIYSRKHTSAKDVKTITTKDVLVDIKKGSKKTYLFIKKAMAQRKYRYPTVVLGVFLGIYLLFNLPLIYTRLSWKNPTNSQKVIVKTEEVVQKKMADSAALAPGEVIPSESRVIIPKINVNAPIVYADTKDEKAIENLLRNGVVHYQGTALPGTVGNSFITGHSSNYWWDTGKYNQIFVLLDKLEPGDQVVVYRDGKKFVYTVRDKVVVAPEDISVLAPTDTPVLSLMTCTPPGTSWKRLVVRLDMTDPVFFKSETVTKESVVEPPKEEKKSFFSGILSFLIPN
jgi:LPXTG-site transpeptidase (sortase) family protein